MFGLMKISTHKRIVGKLEDQLRAVIHDRDELDREVVTTLGKLTDARKALEAANAKINRMLSGPRKANAKRHAEAEAKKAARHDA